MIGHHARFRENDDLPVWRGPAVKKKPPFFSAPALITRKIMRSRDAQCNTVDLRVRVSLTYVLSRFKVLNLQSGRERNRWPH